LTKPQFEFRDVEKLAEGAEEWYKEPKFRPSNGEKLVGMVPPG
jgi:catalase